MAIVGHWVASFLAAVYLPEASVVLLCKLTMLSDTLFGLLGMLAIERFGIYAHWIMSTPPPGTMALVEEWKRNGLWLPGEDFVPGQDGFTGFGALFSVYVDISYSHSVELMALSAVPIIMFMWARYGIRAKYALAILFVCVSHPLLDMVFHDANFLMGNRAKTRVSFNLWQITWLGPVLFIVEVLMAYVPYRMWLRTKQPITQDKNTEEEIAKWKGLFWQIAITHNMVSWYIVSPAIQWAFYNLAPQPTFAFGADNFWSCALLAITVWSWSIALYPLYRLEALLVPAAEDWKTDKTNHDLEAPSYMKLAE
eukprot:CAMPEP_0176045050 /NCGR_PEP_ID=MMETSP0120_2-20121206/22361_1 /TAXON_ID=160619 /ORGANISM="Kryptoperidinium foliaceum, Strain CCMP 1326" /LENGTH=309 /DNA_ID=CAMNT_0017378455 /DNA_START=45 /DNA_END=974 /DNA_ORIENTATION=+